MAGAAQSATRAVRWSMPTYRLLCEYMSHQPSGSFSRQDSTSEPATGAAMQRLSILSAASVRARTSLRACISASRSSGEMTTGSGANVTSLPSSADAELPLGPSAPSVPGIDVDRNVVRVGVSQLLRAGCDRGTHGGKGKKPRGAGARLESVRHWRTEEIRDRCATDPTARNRANTGDIHPS